MLLHGGRGQHRGGRGAGQGPLEPTQCLGKRGKHTQPWVRVRATIDKAIILCMYNNVHVCTVSTCNCIHVQSLIIVYACIICTEMVNIV